MRAGNASCGHAPQRPACRTIAAVVAVGGSCLLRRHTARQVLQGVGVERRNVALGDCTVHKRAEGGGEPAAGSAAACWRGSAPATARARCCAGGGALLVVVGHLTTSRACCSQQMDPPSYGGTPVCLAAVPGCSFACAASWAALASALLPLQAQAQQHPQQAQRHATRQHGRSGEDGFTIRPCVVGARVRRGTSRAPETGGYGRCVFLGACGGRRLCGGGVLQPSYHKRWNASARGRERARWRRRGGLAAASDHPQFGPQLLYNR